MEQSDFLKAQRTVYLIDRFIHGNIDFAELQELESWRKEATINEALFQELNDVEKQEQAIKKMQHYVTAGSFHSLQPKFSTISTETSLGNLQSAHVTKIQILNILLWNGQNKNLKRINLFGNFFNYYYF